MNYTGKNSEKKICPFLENEELFADLRKKNAHFEKKNPHFREKDRFLLGIFCSVNNDIKHIKIYKLAQGHT